jgi:hypothetical protein
LAYIYNTNNSGTLSIIANKIDVRDDLSGSSPNSESTIRLL